jgi:hypothetical protein
VIVLFSIFNCGVHRYHTRMNIPPALQSMLEPWLIFLAEDPVLRVLQIGMLCIAVVAVFLVFFTTRDILLRTNSFLYMFFCILLVAFIPFIGFFLYLLLRPSCTLRERALDEALLHCVEQLQQSVPKKKKPTPDAVPSKK